MRIIRKKSFSLFLRFACSISLMLPHIISGAAAIAYAAIPHLINYQGRLTNAAKIPLTGTYSMTFTVYDALSGGNSLWTETNASVVVSNGIYSVQLGSVETISESVFSAGDSTYLEVKVGDETLSSRTRDSGTPYSIRK